MKKEYLLLACMLTPGFCKATTWHVGSAQTYTLPSQIKNLVHDGDTIYIDGGIYANDATKWTNNNLKFIGLGTGTNRTTLQYTGDIPNGKGIFVFESPGSGDNAYLENIVFDGAQVSDANGGNGSGLRYQAKNLTVNNCKFMNCQNGILEGNGSVTGSNVVIINSEFYNDGYQLASGTYSGYEHPIYISASTDTLLVTNCWFHHPRGQANSLKTRAQRSYILYNLIDEEATGYGSWELNIAQGGLNIIMGNIIIQGPAGANHGIVGYDAVINPLEDFYFVNNTVINQFNGIVEYFDIIPSSGINTFKIYNNIFASIPAANTTLLMGNIPAILDTSHNLVVSNYLSLGFNNPAADDFSLTSSALAAIDHGINAGTTNTSYSLTPVSMYHSYNTPLLPRSITGGIIDLGAYEYAGSSGITENQIHSNISFYPNPSKGKFFYKVGNRHYKNVKIEIYNMVGKEIYYNSNFDNQTSNEIDLSNFPKGIYLVKIDKGKGLETGKIIIQ